MFTSHDAGQAMDGLRLLHRTKILEEAKHFSSVMQEWFQGLSVYIYPNIMNPVVPDVEPNQHGTAWSWGTSVYPPLVSHPVGYLSVRLFVNGNSSPAMALEYNPNTKPNAPDWDAMLVWGLIQEYADKTLDEPGTFRAYYGARMYVAELPAGG